MGMIKEIRIADAWTREKEISEVGSKRIIKVHKIYFWKEEQHGIFRDY